MSQAAITHNPLEALRSVSGTDTGRTRDENQDFLCIVESAEYRLYAVADGMGGRAGGAIAARIAINTLRDSVREKGEINERVLHDALARAHREILEQASAKRELAGMGTTIVVLGFAGTRMYLANIGDSRAYRVRAGVITQLTEDHTVVGELVRAGALTREQASKAPVSHILTRSLGGGSELSVDSWFCEDGPIAADRYILCSDGLYNLVPAEELLELCTQYPMHQLPDVLIRLANERGGTDNTSVVVVEIANDFPITAEVVERARPRRKRRRLRRDVTSLLVAATCLFSGVGIGWWWPRTNDRNFASSNSISSQDLTSVRGELDRATRRLVAWYGRKQRLADPSMLLDLAAEVAITSESVANAKQEYDLSSTEYLRQAETLLYAPADSMQERAVAKSRSDRDALLEKLRAVLSAAIESELAAALEQVRALSQTRDQAE